MATFSQNTTPNFFEGKNTPGPSLAQQQLASGQSINFASRMGSAGGVQQIGTLANQAITGNQAAHDSLVNLIGRDRAQAIFNQATENFVRSQQAGPTGLAAQGVGTGAPGEAASGGETVLQNTGQGFQQLFGGLPPQQNVQQQVGEQMDLLGQSSQRQAELLRQQLGGQQEQSIQALRRELASRGALDSGSLGAGISQIARGTGEQLAQAGQQRAAQMSQLQVELLSRAQDRIQQNLQFLTNQKADAIKFMSDKGLSYNQLDQQDRQFFAQNAENIRQANLQFTGVAAEIEANKQAQLRDVANRPKQGGGLIGGTIAGIANLFN